MTNLMKKLGNSEDGATAIEYGLIAALVAIALITALNTLGTNLSGLLDGVSNTLASETPAEGGAGGAGAGSTDSDSGTTTTP